MPSKGISADSQVHISIAFLIKAMIGIAMLIATYYQVQMKFASMDRSMNDMHQELIVLNSKMATIEKKQKEELEHHNEVLEEENKSLMLRLGLTRK